MKEGEIVQDFSLNDAEGKEVLLQDFRGKTVILVFYPGDFTAVCTKQLCDYRDHLILPQDKFQVIGINANSEESHKKFQEAYRLPYLLLSDPEKKVCKQFGMTTFGVVSRGIVVIGPQGEVRKTLKMLPVFRPSTQKIMELLVESGLWQEKKTRG